MNKKSSDVLTIINDVYGSLTKSQKHIAKYLVDNARDVCFMSASEIAAKLEVSEATITRFVSALGYSNFSEIRNLLKKGMQSFNSPYERAIKTTEFARKDLCTVINSDDDAISYLSYDIEQLNKLKKNINMETIDEAARIIGKAKKVFLMGIGTCSAFTGFLHNHLRQLGISVICVSEGNKYNLDAFITAKKGDVFLALTMPRYSKAIYQAISYANSSGLKVVTITDSSATIFRKYSDVFLSIDTESIFNPHSFFNSIIVTMEVCQILIIRLIATDRQFYKKRLKESTSNSIKIKNRIGND
jgi:DNA-binding MurR/RpiR family transcriptional regulator